MKAICPVCGKEFTPPDRPYGGRTKRYCSAACRRKHEKDRVKAAIKAAKAGRKCAWCGKDISHRNASAKFCSWQCKHAAKRGRATSMAVGRNVSASKARNAAPNITFVQKGEPQERSSIARVEAYLSLPAAERWARRDTLTKKEQAMARDLWLKIKCQRPVYHSAMAY